MGDYRYALSETVAELALGQNNRERKILSSVFRQIASSPHLEGDFVDHDDTGRLLHVKLFGQWLITWWPDHAERGVRIVDVIRV